MAGRDGPAGVEEQGMDTWGFSRHLGGEGDAETRGRELRAAHRLFVAMGAPIRAEQVDRELAAEHAGTARCGAVLLALDGPRSSLR